jgi:hypothetical protein
MTYGTGDTAHGSDSYGPHRRTSGVADGEGGLFTSTAT